MASVLLNEALKLVVLTRRTPHAQINFMLKILHAFRNKNPPQENLLKRHVNDVANNISTFCRLFAGDK